MKSMMKTLGRCVVVALVSLSAACGQSGTSTSTTAPSTTAPPSAVEAFSGTLQPAGTNLHSFTVKETGYVEITLLGVVPQLVTGPSAPITVGLGIGTPNPATCPRCRWPAAYGHAGATRILRLLSGIGSNDTSGPRVPDQLRRRRSHPAGELHGDCRALVAAVFTTAHYDGTKRHEGHEGFRSKRTSCIFVRFVAS